MALLASWAAWPNAATRGLLLPLCAAACGDGDSLTRPGDGEPNRAPAAVAAAELDTVAVGAVVRLDGSASVDPDGDALEYRWRLLSRPVESAADIAEDTRPRPRLEVDRAGAYSAELTVSDGLQEDRDTAFFMAVESPVLCGAVDSDTLLHGRAVPYLVTCDLSIRARLDLAAGTKFRVAEGVRIVVEPGGVLDARGTEGDPIRILGQRESRNSWSGLDIRSASPENRLVHAEVAHGGGGESEANVRVGERARLSIRSTLLHRSSGYGLSVAETGLLAAFEDNHIVENGRAAVRLPVRQLTRLDSGTRYTSIPGKGSIRVVGGIVDADGTWPRTDVPLVFTGAVEVHAVLEVQPGARLLFEPEGALVVASGSLRAVGTAADTISIAGTSAAPGHWLGIVIHSDRPANRFGFASIGFAGASGSGVGGEGANITVGAGARASITDSRIHDSAGWGISLEEGASAVLNRNDFADNAAGDVRGASSEAAAHPPGF